MNTAAEPALVFAGYVLDARRRLLLGPDGAPVGIASRAFETLHYLASHPHELIEKQRLMRAVWPNSMVEENNLTQQISTLRKALGEAAGEHRFIVTVTGRGYRFVQDVQELGSLPAAANGPSAGLKPYNRGMPSREYLLSLPERVVRSALGLSAGLLREVGEVVLPRAVRRSQLYQSLVDTTLRFVIEQVGGAEGVYPAGEPQPDDFLKRRGAGNAIELLGIVAFRVSPVWVLAALADLSGLGRRLIPEISDALKAQGLLEKETRFESMDQLLDGLEKTSARLAATINTPPLDVAGLRQEWAAIRSEARFLKPQDLPSTKAIETQWADLNQESARQGRSVFETSSVMAVSAVRALPEKARWLSASARVGAAHTGKLLSTAILDHYSQTLNELREVGYLTYAKRQLSPYLRACVDQFSPQRRTLTQRLLDRMRKN